MKIDIHWIPDQIFTFRNTYIANGAWNYQCYEQISNPTRRHDLGDDEARNFKTAFIHLMKVIFLPRQFP